MLGDDGYDAARVSFNGILDRRPVAIVSCASTEDDAGAVRAARELNLPIAIRGGGHSVAGHSLPDDALVVSLDRMRGVSVDPDRRLARAGGGAKWNNVDAAAFRHGLAVPGGTFGDTGIGGLTLGGGLGWLMPIAGLTCDNLLAAEIVTADGAVLTASLDHDADLVAPASLTGGGYVNYAPVDESADRIKAAYGADRYARLVAIKRRLDPGNVYRFNHNVRPD